jgi:homoserine dehydrogenase
MKQELNIAIAGLGIVGGGVYEILNKEIDLLNKRSKLKINLVAVSSRTKKDFINESKIKFYQNSLDLADDKNIDLIVETIGGADGIAFDLCKKTLQNKKHYVTANKAMIATHGLELAKLAEENNVALCFEAAVAGAIPVVKNIKEGLAANKISKIYGILNGTCNYILTKMEEDKASFSDALQEAQKLGYAEADPTFDIEGIDSAHKIAILAALAKNSIVKLDKMHIEGITKISLLDIKFAGEFGYKIKSLGVFQDLPGNKIKQAVYPCLVSAKQNIAKINDSFNAILSLGNNANWNLQVGRGAGSKTTASAVVADIIDIANNRFSYAFGAKASQLNPVEIDKINDRNGCYYIRFYINKNFAKEHDFIKNIFIERPDAIKQTIVEDVDKEKMAYGIITNEFSEKAIIANVNQIAKSNQVNDINLIRIEDID